MNRNIVPTAEEERASLHQRRRWLAQAGSGFGATALSWMMANESQAATARQPGPHFAPKAKNVIFLFMYGGPSHIDLFDPKPELEKWHGKAIPVFRKEDAFMGKTNPNALKSPFKFAKYGESGLDISDRFPRISDLRRRPLRYPFSALREQ